MLKRLLLKLPIHLAIFLLLAGVSSYIIINGGGLGGLAIILFGTPLIYWLYKGKPWIKEKKKFPIVNFLLIATMMLVSLFMTVGPYSIWKHSAKQMEEAPLYSFANNMDEFMIAEKAILTDYQSSFQVAGEMQWMVDSIYNMDIALQQVYQDSGNIVFAVFAIESGRKDELSKKAKEVMQKEPSELVVLAHPPTRGMIIPEYAEFGNVQLIQWQSKESIENDLKSGVLGKMLVSLALLLVIVWIDQRSAKFDLD